MSCTEKNIHKNATKNDKDILTVHVHVQELLKTVASILNKYERVLAPQTIQAVKAFFKELNKVLIDNAQQGDVGRTLPAAQLKLVQQSIAIIDKYKPQLEAAPGFWN